MDAGRTNAMQQEPVEEHGEEWDERHSGADHHAGGLLSALQRLKYAVPPLALEVKAALEAALVEFQLPIVMLKHRTVAQYAIRD
jgi:hypothetical protein